MEEEEVVEESEVEGAVELEEQEALVQAGEVEGLQTPKDLSCQNHQTLLQDFPSHLSGQNQFHPDQKRISGWLSYRWDHRLQVVPQG